MTFALIASVPAQNYSVAAMLTGTGKLEERTSKFFRDVMLNFTVLDFGTKSFF